MKRNGLLLRAVDVEKVLAAVRGGFPGDGWDLVLREGRPLPFAVLSTTTSALYRCAGVATRQGERRAWSVIVKLVRPHETAIDAQRWSFWLRECRAYGSGLLRELQGSLSAAPFFGTWPGPGQTQVLLLEDLAGLAAPTTLRDDARVVRHLGAFSGAGVALAARHHERWLSTRLLEQMFEQAAESIAWACDETTLANPKLVAAFPVSVRLRMLHLLHHRERYLGVLRRLPQTLCHHDFYPANVFTGRAQTVAIDWSYVGRGPIGADLGQWLSGSLMWLLRDPRFASAQYAQSLRAYRLGLEDAGVRVSTDEVEIAVATTAALRTLVFLPVLFDWLTRSDGEAMWRARFGRDLRRSLRPWGSAVTFLLDLAHRARELGA